MIRKSLLTLVLMAFVGFVTAQSLTVLNNGVALAEGETIICNNYESGYEFLQELQIMNNSDLAANVIFGKVEIEVPADGAVYFCCGSCYGPDVNESPRPTEIPAHSATEEGLVSVHYMDNGAIGSALAMFYVFDERTPEERVTFYVRFNDPSSVGTNLSKVNMSSAYPNPASSEVRFDVNCEGNASIAIYNLLGQEVMSQNVENGQVVLSVADLNEGIYFCNLTVNGQTVKTEKFIVKK